MTESEWRALPEERQITLKEQQSSEEERSEADVLMAPTATLFMDSVRSSSDDLEAIFAQYSDVHSRFEVSTEDSTYWLKYYSGAEPNRIEEYKRAIRKIVKATGFGAKIEPVDYLYSRNEAVLSEIVAREGVWAERLGDGNIVGAPDPLGDGVVRVGVALDGVEGKLDASWQKSEIDGVSVVFTSSDSPLVEPQSRIVDYSPYSPGARLNKYNGSFVCTNGFGWRRWSDNKLMGSTAAHCYGYSGADQFFNNGNIVGTRNASHQNFSKDAVLMTLYGGNSVAPNVYVGASNSSTIYPLVGAAVLPIGSPIALTGASSGSHVSSVAAKGLQASYTTINGSSIVVSPLYGTWSRTANSGDSGGGWITSDSKNRAYAHGSHFGYATIPGVGSYASYIDINTFSAAVKATIYTQ
ncbi:hypothetical protein [Leucobacter sp. USHLN153]|uniref:hypothetical protein n=1 Tax=Leucobacter sp. USHLN153 TaxID=3081268 RepID=UPI00301A1785